jgi:hypothetical protein
LEKIFSSNARVPRGKTGISEFMLAGPANDFLPAWMVNLPGHCTVMFPPSIVMFAPPAVDKLMLLAAAQSIWALGADHIDLVARLHRNVSACAWTSMASFGRDQLQSDCHPRRA